MMKYTDRFFSFPIKVYDLSPTNEKLYDLTKYGGTSKPEDELDWVEGYCRLPYHVFENESLYWYEGYSKGRTPEEVAKEGSDLTIIISKELGEFVCTWSKGKFEERLNTYIEKMETEDLIPRHIQRMVDEAPIQLHSSKGNIEG